MLHYHLPGSHHIKSLEKVDFLTQSICFHENDISKTLQLHCAGDFMFAPRAHSKTHYYIKNTRNLIDNLRQQRRDILITLNDVLQNSIEKKKEEDTFKPKRKYIGKPLLYIGLPVFKKKLG